jgi:hypothetical protein
MGPDALGALFGGAQISARDESAAMGLAAAFSETNGAEPAAVGTAPAMAGETTKRAAGELSLDSVFGGSAAAPAAPASFSFDQFFSQGASAPGGAGENEPGAQSQEDVAQFTQWLEGLKKK